MNKVVSIKFNESINTWALVELQHDGPLFRVSSCGGSATFKMSAADLQMLARTAVFLEGNGYMKEDQDD